MEALQGGRPRDSVCRSLGSLNVSDERSSDDERSRSARPPRGVDLLFAVIRRYLDHAMTVYAAAVSFWAMVSLVPLVAMLVFAVAIFVEPETVETFIEEITLALPGETIEVLVAQVQTWVTVSREISTVGLVIAVIIAAWGASLGMSHLMRAINVAHALKPRNIVRRRITALMHTVAALAFAIPIVILVAATPAAMAAADTPSAARWAVGFVRWPIVLALFVTALAALYWAAPSRRPPFRWWSPGVAVAVVIFLAASGLFSLYVANIDRYDSSYGSLGTVVVTMLWFYVTTSAILVGAEVDALGSGELGSDGE